MRGRIAVGSALVALTVLLATPCAHAQNVSAASLRSVAAIVTDRDAKRVAIGTGFFVEVASKSYLGNAFVYLVTARHNLLDEDGRPLAKLWVRLEDASTGAVRDDPLPPEPKWILDPKNDKADIAALPFPPSKARFTTIPLAWFLGANAETTITVDEQIGASAYYLTMTSSGAVNPRLVAVTRFGRVSVAEPTRSDVPGIGEQNLCFLDGASAPEFSGAPVFIRTVEKFVFWGILEARTANSSGGMLAGLVGVLPASYVAETVEAMVAAQERTVGSKP